MGSPILLEGYTSGFTHIVSRLHKWVHPYCQQVAQVGSPIRLAESHALSALQYYTNFTVNLLRYH